MSTQHGLAGQLARVEDADVPGDQRAAFIRAELRFELGLLHDRTNALLSAEAFLTIAYTTAMGNGTAWGTTFSAVVSPVLSVLGLLLALLTWPGVASTARLVLAWTAELSDLMERDAELSSGPSGLPGHAAAYHRLRSDQRRSLLFFRLVPVLFALVWSVLIVVAVVLTR